ncbi:uncharacterized protein [Clytia hemisphaerica]|uniref:Uncharacterized protein n=1 Tax=Clytia hemisphaerica TaxID=252671 RepID=A0A7M6DQ49_9CNID|eukprot:TCONS_00029177-protein
MMIKLALITFFVSSSFADKYSVESCREVYTNWNDDGNGGLVYLDRHDVRCKGNEYIKYMKLQRKYVGWFKHEIRYKYICCPTAACINEHHSTQDRYNGGGQGNAFTLKHQSVDCGKNALQQVKLVRTGDNIRYDYTCCKKPNPSLTTSCKPEKRTEPKDAGHGNAAYLDRHTISCHGTDYYLASFRLYELRFVYNRSLYIIRCCKIN